MGGGCAHHGRTTANIRVITTYKGEEQVTRVRTASSPAACGLDPAKGEEYLLYPREINLGIADVNVCDGSQPFNNEPPVIPAEGPATAGVGARGSVSLL